MTTAWTEEEDSILLSSHADGLSDRAIAGLLDRSETACRKRRQRLGATEPMNLVDRARLLQLHAEGRTNREIAEALGSTLRTLRAMLSRRPPE